MQLKLTLLGLFTAANLAAAADTTTTQSRPNILIILADDSGYGDFGAQGEKTIPTPHIDSIAAGGVKFTSAYVTCPVCGPSRAGLLSGRYQQRFGFEVNPGPNEDPNFGLTKETRLLPEYLRNAGYQTGMVGKWHLGFQPHQHPNNRGFDFYYGFLSGARTYFPDPKLNNKSKLLLNQQPVEKEPAYLTDAFGDQAARFIRDASTTSPFFLYLAFNAMHAPLEVPEESLKEFAHITDPKRRTYAAMTRHMDNAIGRALQALKQRGLMENTIITFLSDNGGAKGLTAQTGPLRGQKGQIYEGGIRVPMYVQWQGHLPAGKVYDNPIISLDIFPTVFAAANLQPPAGVKLDGRNILPYLQDQPTTTAIAETREPFFWRFSDQNLLGAIRHGDYKLLFDSPRDAAPDWQLYNLKADIAEKNNLAAQNPAKVAELSKLWNTWSNEMAEPGWIDSRTRRAILSGDIKTSGPVPGMKDTGESPQPRPRRGKKKAASSEE